ncbi:hypothetical protein ACR6C2_03095 [Streptomyces sp. INA 01156]
MRSASTEHPGSEHPVRHTPRPEWHVRHPSCHCPGCRGATSRTPPGRRRPSPAAQRHRLGDADTARSALADLRKRICQYGFVVEQATAATVPFLWELAQLPHVSCRVEIIRLLKAIADARQWESTAAAYPKLLNHRENPVVWERAARQAVRARRGDLNRLMADRDTKIARATTELAHALAD